MAPVGVEGDPVRNLVRRAELGRDDPVADPAAPGAALQRPGLAEQLGVRPATVGWWETGLKEPSAESYARLARLIPAPLAGGDTLSGYEAGILQLRWSASLPRYWQ